MSQPSYIKKGDIIIIGNGATNDDTCLPSYLVDRAVRVDKISVDHKDINMNVIYFHQDKYEWWLFEKDCITEKEPNEIKSISIENLFRPEEYDD